MKRLIQLFCAIILFLAITGFKDDYYHNYIILNTERDTLIQIRLENNGNIFPKYVYRFNYVDNLLINNCWYEKIPEEICTFTELETLWVEKCYVLDYEDMFYKLRYNTKLKEIILVNDSLSSIPESIKYLINLENFDLVNNRLEELPKELFTLSNLIDIHLSGNRIKRFNIEGDTNFTVKYLQLDNNNLEKIPDGLEKLKALETLNLDDNPNLSLEEICNIIPHLPNLDLLYIMGIKNSKGRPLPKNINNLKKYPLAIHINSRQFSEEQLQYFRDNDIPVIFYDR